MKILVIALLIFKGLLGESKIQQLNFFAQRLTRELSEFASRVMHSCTEDPNIRLRIMLFTSFMSLTVGCMKLDENLVKILLHWTLASLLTHLIKCGFISAATTPAFACLGIKSWHFDFNQSKSFFESCFQICKLRTMIIYTSHGYSKD